MYNVYAMHGVYFFAKRLLHGGPDSSPGIAYVIPGLFICTIYTDSERKVTHQWNGILSFSLTVHFWA